MTGPEGDAGACHGADSIRCGTFRAVRLAPGGA
jgi:hypothetical protein